MERRVPVQSSRSMYLCGAWEQKVGAMNREPSRLHTLPWASGTGKAATMKQQVYAVRWTTPPAPPGDLPLQLFS